MVLNQCQFSKIAPSFVKRPIQKNTVFNTARAKAVVTTTKPKAVINTVWGDHFYDVKSSACWVWKSKIKVLGHVSKHNSASIVLKKFDYVDVKGISKSVLA